MTRRVSNKLLLVFCSVIAPLASAAEEQPVVLAEIEPAVVAVGEPVTLRVSVFAPTWFPKPPEFPSFELPNTITRLPPNSSGPVTRRIGRSTWSGVQRRYQIYPLVSGTFRLADRSVEVTYADPASRAPISMTVPVPEVGFDSQVPAGAAGLEPYLAGRTFSLQREARGDASVLAAGDALVLVYRARLDGMPSLFLPPLFEAPDQSGLSSYVDEPRLADEEGMAEREETVTLIFEHGGDYVLPAVELSWWNRDVGVLETARIPELTLSVSGPLASAGDEAVVAEQRQIWELAALVVAVGVFVLVLWRPVRTAIARRAAARAAHERTEAFAFARLCEAVRDGDAPGAYRRLLRWLAHFDDVADLEDFSRRFGDTDFHAQLEVLRRSLYGEGERADFDRGLLASLEVARARVRAGRNAEQRLLPALNPTA